MNAYIASHGEAWRNSKHRAQWSSTMATYAKSISDTPVDAVSEDDVLEILKPIWTTKPETASRVRGRIEATLDFARARKWRAGENPARWRGHLKHLLPARQKLNRGHHPAAPYADVPALYDRIAGQPGVGAVALRFAILTAARSGEVRGMTWDEVDVENRALWIVPAMRMKAGIEHRVPLSNAALGILRPLRPKQPAIGELVFKSPRTGKALSDMTLSAVLRRMKVEITVHGFRSSFRDWAGDQTEFDRETAEAALAHTIRDETERAYRRGDALEKRRKLMKAWAEWCSAEVGGA
ncbi:MAG: tyrosine-type recombinase/integrase [Caulobacteraceae bacterium]